MPFWNSICHHLSTSISIPLQEPLRFQPQDQLRPGFTLDHKTTILLLVAELDTIQSLILDIQVYNTCVWKFHHIARVAAFCNFQQQTNCTPCCWKNYLEHASSPCHYRTGARDKQNATRCEDQVHSTTCTEAKLRSFALSCNGFDKQQRAFHATTSAWPTEISKNLPIGSYYIIKSIQY